MSGALDPSLLAWVRSFAADDDAPKVKPPRPSNAAVRRAAPPPPARKPEAREGRARTAAWLQEYMADGDWYEANDLREASKAVGILNNWLVDELHRIGEWQNRDRRVSYRLRREGDGA